MMSRAHHRALGDIAHTIGRGGMTSGMEWVESMTRSGTPRCQPKANRLSVLMGHLNQRSPMSPSAEREGCIAAGARVNTGWAGIVDYAGLDGSWRLRRRSLSATRAAIRQMPAAAR